MATSRYMKGAYQNPLPGVPAIESPFFEQIFAGETSSEFMRVARSLHDEGFAVIDFPDAELETVGERIINDLNDHYDWQGWHQNGGMPPRIQDAWKFNEDVRQVAVNSAIIDLLSKLYGRRAFPFQTINFPMGTQQDFHSDSVHFSSQPERFMCGVWLALEDVDENNGPLEYYPKSHKLPLFFNEAMNCAPQWSSSNPVAETYQPYVNMWRQLVEAYQLERREFYPRKGQAIIWAANLLHGGAVQRDLSRTRHSQVTHYFFEDCAYYTPVLSVPFLGAIAYRDVIDITQNKPVEQRVCSVKVPQHFMVSSSANIKKFAREFQQTSSEKLFPQVKSKETCPQSNNSIKQKLKKMLGL